LAKIIKNYDREFETILFKVNHPYFSKFNFEPYKKYFDKIIEFDFITYRKNFIKGVFEALIFQRKLKKVIPNFLRNFQEIDLFLEKSAWLPVNILLNHLSREKNIKNIIKFTLAIQNSSQTKIDGMKTILCNLYSLPFKCYKIKVLTSLAGKFVDFDYSCDTPGKLIKIVSPIRETKKIDILSYPIVSEYSGAIKKDVVIIFGDETIFNFYSEYLPDYETFIEKLTTFFKTIENKYSDCKLYYKPHPGDKGKLLPGIDSLKYNFFDNTINAQTLLDFYCQRIKAVYTFSSSSAIFSSFFGIPSYTFYRYVCNQVGIEKFDKIFNQDNLKSKFLYHISKLNEVGKIDNLERPNFKKFDEIYKKILNI